MKNVIYWVKWFEDEHIWHMASRRRKADAQELVALLKKAGVLRVTMEKERL